MLLIWFKALRDGNIFFSPHSSIDHTRATHKLPKSSFQYMLNFQQISGPTDVILICISGLKFDKLKILFYINIFSLKSVKILQSISFKA